MTKLRKSVQADITGRCGARTRSGSPCKQAAGWGTDHPGVGRCKLHGGATPRGLDSPHFRHGLRCRYLAPPLKARDEECPVTLEDLERGTEEAVGIIRWAQKLATSPGEVPPLMVIHALLSVINAKLKVKELEREVDPSPLRAEVIETLGGELMDAVERAGVPEECWPRLAEELGRIDRGEDHAA